MVDWRKDGYPYVIFAWILFAIVTILVPVRLYVQLRNYYRPWRELFVILAWAEYLVFCIAFSVSNDLDLFNYEIDYNSTHYQDEVTAQYNLGFCHCIVHLQILYACKAALLCFYNDLNLAMRSQPSKIWWAIVITGVCVAGAAINDLLNNILWYRAPGDWPAFYNGAMHHWTSATYWLHPITDLMVFIIPFPIIWSLPNLSFGEKLGAYGIFALGLFNIAQALLFVIYYLYIGYISASFLDISYYVNPAFGFLYSAHPASGIMLACLPYCRRLWVDITSRRKTNVAMEAPPPTTTHRSSSISDRALEDQIGVDDHEIISLAAGDASK